MTNILIKDGKAVEDNFTDVSAEASIPASGAIIVSLEQWQADAGGLKDRNEPLGIILRSDEKPELIAGDLDAFAVIALDFPAFGDGRAYSYARLLRDRYNYAGELRATGDVLLEQLHFMHRVGFNAFAVKSGDAVSDWETAAADLSVWYQPTNDGRKTAIQLRHD